MSVLLTPVDGIATGGTAVAVHPVTDGFQIAGFDTRGHIGFVVSALSEDDNLALARELAPILQAYFRQDRSGRPPASRLRPERRSHLRRGPPRPPPSH